jgi:SOS-response transcriptional repressor LexA
MSAGERIAQVREELGLSQQALSDRVNRIGGEISQTGIDKIEKRGTKRPRFLREIAAALGVSDDWLVTGKGQKSAPPKGAAKPTIDLPIISWVSAGEMSKPDMSDVQIGNIAMSGLDANGDWIALQVDGDSMDRISPPGSIVIVNRKDKRLVPNACFVIADDDGNATYKRFRANPPRFEPVSTNPAHEAIFPENEPVIVGRVRRSVLEM